MKSIGNYFMIGFLMLAIASAATACSGATGDVGPNVDESNAAAKAAVSYESGAGFVEALAQAGRSLYEIRTVTPYTVPTAQGPIHVADTVSCNYADDDWITGFVACSHRRRAALTSKCITNRPRKPRLMLGHESDAQGGTSGLPLLPLNRDCSLPSKQLAAS